MSKSTDDRETPQEFYNELDREFGFDLDCAASTGNTKCQRWLGPGSAFMQDALAEDHDWAEFGRRFWLNPPYSEIKPWIRRMAVETISPKYCGVMLLPSSTSSKWFHSWIWDAQMHRPRSWIYQVRFPTKRLTFGPHHVGAKWPSMVVVFGNPHRIE